MATARGARVGKDDVVEQGGAGACVKVVRAFIRPFGPDAQQTGESSGCMCHGSDFSQCSRELWATNRKASLGCTLFSLSPPHDSIVARHSPGLISSFLHSSIPHSSIPPFLHSSSLPHSSPRPPLHPSPLHPFPSLHLSPPHRLSPSSPTSPDSKQPRRSTSAPPFSTFPPCVLHCTVF